MGNITDERHAAERRVIYPLAPNGIFWTLQGEGALMGEPMAFVRLAGCSVGCPQCDTDYRVSRRLTPEQIIEEVRGVVPEAVKWPWVWITGGEPTDHELGPLVSLLKTMGFRVALATSGVRQVAVSVDWLSVSPHTSAPTQRHGHELKIVPGLNALDLEAVSELRRLSFAYKFVQPVAVDGKESPESMRACRDFVLANPGWRLTLQAHRGWSLP